MPNQSEQQPLAVARPQIVITVQVNGQTQVYDIPTAKVLRDELIAAINSVENPPKPSRKKATRKKRRKKK